MRRFLRFLIALVAPPRCLLCRDRAPECVDGLQCLDCLGWEKDRYGDWWCPQCLGRLSLRTESN